MNLEAGILNPAAISGAAAIGHSAGQTTAAETMRIFDNPYTAYCRPIVGMHRIYPAAAIFYTKAIMIDNLDSNKGGHLG
ncbi:MAG: hypothetical protein K9L59_05150 [Desulfobacterales bacterium]|nr:hypothetical protein [Desulfobacterales bacterium]MCF8080734.1 hypothetical protein [Desulfobacterales bacterium]